MSLRSKTLSWDFVFAGLWYINVSILVLSRASLHCSQSKQPMKAWKMNQAWKCKDTTCPHLYFCAGLKYSMKREIYDTLGVKEGCFVNLNVVYLAFRINLLIFWKEPVWWLVSGFDRLYIKHVFLNELWFLGFLWQNKQTLDWFIFHWCMETND